MTTTLEKTIIHLLYPISWISVNDINFLEKIILNKNYDVKYFKNTKKQDITFILKNKENRFLYIFIDLKKEEMKVFQYE